MAKEQQSRILKLLQEKIILKEEVLEKTQSVFSEMKKHLSELSTTLKSSVKDISKTAPVLFEETGKFEMQFTIADEILLFATHSNIFTFDTHHEIWRNKYVQQDPKRAFCGKIFIYNFLSDSFKYNRSNDIGYLIARIFVNREGHFFIEGKQQLGYSFTEFSKNVFNTDVISTIIEESIVYSLDFDPFTPPFERISEMSVKDIQEFGLQSRLTTGKRLGFEFGSDSEKI